MSLEAGAACVRARRKKEVVVRRMNFMVGKDWRRVDEQVLCSLLRRYCERKMVTVLIS